MTPHHFTDNLITKSCKLAVVYDLSTLNDVFIEGVDVSIPHSLRNNWLKNPQADLADKEFQAESLLFIQSGSKNATPTNFSSTNLEEPYHYKPCHNQKTVNTVNTDITSSPTRSPRRQSNSPLFVHSQSSDSPKKPRAPRQAHHHRFHQLIRTFARFVTMSTTSHQNVRS